MLNQLYIITTLLLSSVAFSFGQNSKEHHPESYIQLSGLSDKQKLKELVSIHQGTYQLLVSKEDYAPLLSLNVLDTVITSRQQDANVLIEIDEFTRVFVPSQNNIESESFIPLETILYVTEPTPVEVSE